MEEILSKLKSLGHLDEKVQNEIEALWKYGVGRVTNTELRAGLAHFLESEVPWSFYVLPASLMGKHHPSWQNAKAGIVRNTVECCLAVDRQLRMYPQFTDDRYHVLPEHQDIVLVATIVTDTFKYGEKEPDSTLPDVKYDPLHGKIGADRWEKATAHLPVAPSVRASIYEAVYWHLGRWTPGWSPDVKLSLYAEITHRIDMIFSDRNLELLYDPKEVVR